MSEKKMRRLASLEVGASAQVVSISQDCPNRQRLMEMGVTPGVQVSLVRVAPLNDPLEIFLRGYRLCVSRRQASWIWCS